MVRGQRNEAWSVSAGAGGPRLGLPLCAAVEAGVLCTKATPIGVMWQTIIHCVFILSAIGIAYTDKLMTTVSVKREKEAHQH